MGAERVEGQDDLGHGARRRRRRRDRPISSAATITITHQCRRRRSRLKGTGNNRRALHQPHCPVRLARIHITPDHDSPRAGSLTSTTAVRISAKFPALVVVVPGVVQANAATSIDAFLTGVHGGKGIMPRKWQKGLLGERRGSGRRSAERNGFLGRSATD